MTRLESVELARRRIPRFEDRLEIAAGLSVSPFCLGKVAEPDALEAAFELGINFFFVSADMHWPLYEPTRRGLEALCARGLRDRIVVAGCAYVTQPEFCRNPFQELVAAVPGLKRLDLVVAGGAYGREIGERLPVFRQHRERGFVGARAIAATFHDRRAAAAAANRGDFDLVFVRYNPSHPGARTDCFAALAPGHAPVFGFTSTDGWVSPACAAEFIGDDFWIPRIVDMYRFALTPSAVSGLLCAPASRAEVVALHDVLEDGPLDPEDEDHLIELAARSVASRRDRVA